MRVSFDGLDTFREYAAGRTTANALLEHPAYKRMMEHATWAGAEFTPLDIGLAFSGKPSSFPGLRELRQREAAVRSLEDALRVHASLWAEEACRSVWRLFPGEDLSNVVLYPVLGYDMGIGGNGLVVMNLNVPQYLDNHREFLYYLAHELCHVVFERYHPIPRVPPVADTQAWTALMDWALLSEGSATYCALPMRQQSGGLAERDYLVINDPAAMRTHVDYYLADRGRLAAGGVDKPLELVFSERRAAYRVGCELLLRVEKSHGLAAVRDALHLPPSSVWKAYSSLLSD